MLTHRCACACCEYSHAGVHVRTVSTHAQVCMCLAQIAKHSVELAEVVVEAEIFPKILTCLKAQPAHARMHTPLAMPLSP